MSYAPEFIPTPQVLEFLVTEIGPSLQTQDSTAKTLVFTPGSDEYLVDRLIYHNFRIEYSSSLSYSACTNKSETSALG